MYFALIKVETGQYLARAKYCVVGVNLITHV